MTGASRLARTRGRAASSLVVAWACVAAVGCGSASPMRTVAVAAKTTTATSASETLPALVAKVQGGVVRIETDTCTGQSIGTGFVIGPRLVATVEHVVDGASKITLKQNGSTVGTGTVIGEDSTRDVALIQASAPLQGSVFHLAPRAPQLGESVAALGFPLGLPFTVTKGSVSGTQRTIPISGINRRQLVQTDAAVNPGNSGGPLLSTDTGDVVGLVDIGTNQANGIAFAVSAQVAQPLLQAWQAAPQPIPSADCSATTSTPPAAPTAPPPTAPGTAPTTKAAYAAQFEALSKTWQVAAQDYNSAVNAPGVNDAIVATASAAFSQATTDYANAIEMLTPPDNAASAQADLVSALRAMGAGVDQLTTAAQNNDATAANDAKNVVDAAGQRVTSAAQALATALTGG